MTGPARAGRSADRMIWIDLEMTGLDVEKESIIEIGTVITDGQLNILATGPNLVIHQPEKLLKRMDDWNRNQHGKSGLTQAVRRSKISLRKAEEATLRFVRRYCLPGKSPLCGNAVDHDRRFLIKYMPKLHAYLHYRNVDVSTIKALVARWYPRSRKQPKKAELHRSLADILESIEELRFYRTTYFKRRRSAALTSPAAESTIPA